MGADLDLNQDLILTHERRFAGQVAGEVVDKPVLALWMILIPVFFVFYFFQLKRYKNGLKEFSKNFLVTRQRALQAVYETSQKHSQVDVDELVALSDSPEQVKAEYRLWVEALVDHYQTLISATGSRYEELVRDVYRKKSSYQLALNRLSRAENEFNRALVPHLPGDPDSISQVVEAMAKSVKKIRRSYVAEVFS
jgi:hypothetical protein